MAWTLSVLRSSALLQVLAIGVARCRAVAADPLRLDCAAGLANGCVRPFAVLLLTAPSGCDSAVAAAGPLKALGISDGVTAEDLRPAFSWIPSIALISTRTIAARLLYGTRKVFFGDLLTNELDAVLVEAPFRLLGICEMHSSRCHP